MRDKKKQRKHKLIYFVQEQRVLSTNSESLHCKYHSTHGAMKRPSHSEMRGPELKITLFDCEVTSGFGSLTLILL